MTERFLMASLQVQALESQEARKGARKKTLRISYVKLSEIRVGISKTF
jgi:hypothetical protein